MLKKLVDVVTLLADADHLADVLSWDLFDNQEDDSVRVSLDKLGALLLVIFGKHEVADLVQSGFDLDFGGVLVKLLVEKFQQELTNYTVVSF